MPRARTFLLAGWILLSACSGDATAPNREDPPGNQPPPPVATTLSKNSGDNQRTTVATALNEPLAVKVLDQTGKPMSGVTVNWNVGEGGGTLSRTSSATDSQGLATATLALGPKAGRNVVTASAANLPAVSFTANGIGFWTVMVYMAADNDLTVFGVKDIDEMESVGSSDSVQIVLQAEFNRNELAMYGCGAECINRPNFNTFRYRVPQSAGGPGPDSIAVDIGNRNMTDPADLAEFIRWTKDTYPARRYALVLWNHGGGYQGLLVDDTSAPGNLMTLSSLRLAMTSSNAEVDVINFDMCLMGGVETVAAVEGTVDFAVFSQENEPGDGDPYDRFLSRLRNSPAMGGRELATLMVDEYVTSYRGGASSVTKSAVDLSRWADFRASWNAFAAELRVNLATYSGPMAQAIPRTQNYSAPYMRDLGDFLVRMKAASPSAELTSKIEDLQGKLGGGIVIRNGLYTSTLRDESPNVDRSTGMHVLLPSGLIEDALPSHGPLSFASYMGANSAHEWTAFLEQWLSKAPSLQYYDQGSERIHMGLAWGQEAVNSGVDIDFWVLEPSGDLFIPYLGILTPNGSFNGDSHDTRLWYEIYSTRRYVQRGTYYFFAELWQDPQNYQPQYTILYTSDRAAEWTDIYEDEGYPSLSLERQWRNDAEVTWQKIADGSYTDLQYAAYWEVESASQSRGATGNRVLNLSPAEGRRAMHRARDGESLLTRLTPAQRARLSEILSDPGVREQREAARERAKEAREALELRDPPPSLQRIGSELSRIRSNSSVR